MAGTVNAERLLMSFVMLLAILTTATVLFLKCLEQPSAAQIAKEAFEKEKSKAVKQQLFTTGPDNKTMRFEGDGGKVAEEPTAQQPTPVKASCTVSCYLDAETKKPYIVLVWWDKNGKTQQTRVDSDQQADVTGENMLVTVSAK